MTNMEIFLVALLSMAAGWIIRDAVQMVREDME